MKLPPTHALWLVLSCVGIAQTLLVLKSCHYVAEPPTTSRDDRRPSPTDPRRVAYAARPVSSFWWPSPATSGGFLSAIHRAQHPQNCSANSTRYFVMQSLKENEEDNRGLSGETLSSRWALTNSEVTSNFPPCK